MTVSRQSLDTTVEMPGLGESVEEGTVSRWLCNVGDRVEAEQPLLEVATDKVDTEIPAPCAGTLSRIIAEVNTVVAVGEPLAVITEDSGDTAQPAPPSELAASSELATDSHTADQHPESEHDPTTTQAAGPSASPVDADQPPAPGTSVTETLPRIRRTIARRMVESLQTSAQLTTVLEADVTAIAHLRAVHKDAFLSRTGTKLSFLPFFAKAAAEALTDHRMLNASINTDVTEVTYHGDCHLGIAVDSPKGLMVPVIRGAGDLRLAQLAQTIADLADKVRAGTIAPDELLGGTFTLTNTGSRGALFDTPIINQPQTGILGTGTVVERLIPSRGDAGSLRIEARSIVYLSLSYDHRIVDGADAARFLTAVKTRLENGFGESDLF